MCRYLTSKEFSKKLGVHRSTVQNWAALGVIEGVQKVQRKKYVMYLYPENALPPSPEAVRTATAFRASAKQAATSGGDEHEKQLAFVREHGGTRSIRAIAHELGISTDDVRALYGEVITMGGDAVDEC